MVDGALYLASEAQPLYAVAPIDACAGDDVYPEFIAGPGFEEGRHLTDFFRRQGFAPPNLYGDRVKAHLPDAKLGEFDNFQEFFSANQKCRQGPVTMFQGVG